MGNWVRNFGTHTAILEYDPGLLTRDIAMAFGVHVYMKASSALNELNGISHALS